MSGPALGRTDVAWHQWPGEPSFKIFRDVGNGFVRVQMHERLPEEFRKRRRLQDDVWPATARWRRRP